MNVVVFASRKGGSGKSTLAAHLCAHAHKSAKPCLLIDADPQGSLALWHRLRGTPEPKLRSVARSVGEAVAAAKRDGYEWVFIDTPPTIAGIVEEAVRCATMVVIPARPGIFDTNAIQQTIQICRAARKPYAVVMNGAPARRDEIENHVVTVAREALAAFKAPVWNGQITNRADLMTSLGAGESVREYASESVAASEIARLWAAIERSIKAVRSARAASSQKTAAPKPPVQKTAAAKAAAAKAIAAKAAKAAKTKRTATGRRAA